MPAVHELRRAFDEVQHVIDFSREPWKPTYDEDGRALWGIRGKDGVFGKAGSGEAFGVSLIEMRPGAEFPLHVHKGDHILVGISGRGMVHINGQDIVYSAGVSVFIPGDYPHGVKTFQFEDFTEDELAEGGGLFSFYAFGHPAYPVDSTERMTRVDPADELRIQEDLRRSWGES